MAYIGSILLFIAAGQGIFFSASQVFLACKKDIARLLLGLTIFCFSFPLIESALWMSDSIGRFIHFAGTSIPFAYIFGPLAYFYFHYSFGGQFKWKHFFHIIPFILCVAYASQFWFHSTEEKQLMLDGTRAYSSYFHFYLPGRYNVLLEGISLLTYGLFCFRDFHHRAADMKEVRSWFQLAFGTLLFYSLGFIIFYLLEFLELMEGCADYGISAVTAVFIYLFAWFGMVRPRVFDGYALRESLVPVQQQKYKSSVLTANAETELYERLLKVMLEDKPFLNEGTDLATLASLLDTNRNSLSQVINNKAGMNFFEFINSWRIREAQKLLASTSRKELTVIEIAYEVGFSNKVSFNKAFRHFTGMTPTEFRQGNA